MVCNIIANRVGRSNDFNLVVVCGNDRPIRTGVRVTVTSTTPLAFSSSIGDSVDTAAIRDRTNGPQIRALSGGVARNATIGSLRASIRATMSGTPVAAVPQP